MPEINNTDAMGKKFRPKLTLTEKLELLKFLAEYHSIGEAVEFMRDKFDKELAPSSVQWYIEKKSPYRSLLEKFRREFDKTLIPISLKKVGLHELNNYRWVWKDGNQVYVAPREIKSLESKQIAVGTAVVKPFKNRNFVTFYYTFCRVLRRIWHYWMGHNE